MQKRRNNFFSSPKSVALPTKNKSSCDTWVFLKAPAVAFFQSLLHPPTLSRLSVLENLPSQVWFLQPFRSRYPNSRLKTILSRNGCENAQHVASRHKQVGLKYTLVAVEVRNKSCNRYVKESSLDQQRPSLRLWRWHEVPLHRPAQMAKEQSCNVIERISLRLEVPQTSKQSLIQQSHRHASPQEPK